MHLTDVLPGTHLALHTVLGDPQGLDQTLEGTHKGQIVADNEKTAMGGNEIADYLIENFSLSQTPLL
jgi:hypothetical protein